MSKGQRNRLLITINNYKLRHISEYAPVWTSEYNTEGAFVNWNGEVVGNNNMGMRYTASICTDTMEEKHTDKLLSELRNGVVNFQLHKCGETEFSGKVKINCYRKNVVVVTDKCRYCTVAFDISAMSLINARENLNFSMSYGDTGENNIPYFSNVTVTKSVNIGISTSQLSFTTSANFDAPLASKIKLKGIQGATDFFIYQRKWANGECIINCLDRNALLGKLVELTEEQKKSSYLLVSDILEMCRVRCGYSHVYGLPSYCKRIATADVLGKSYAEVLTKIAEAYYGVWTCERGETLVFTPTGNYSEIVGVSQHTHIDAPIILNNAVNSERTIQEREYGTYNYECLCLANSLYSDNSEYMENFVDDIYNRLTLDKHNFGSRFNINKSFMYCQKAVLDEIPYTVCAFGFAEHPNRYYAANSTTYTITFYGIFASVSNNNGMDEIQAMCRQSKVINDKVHYLEMR